MKILSGAVLFFVLIGSNLQAFDSSAKGQRKRKRAASNWSISGFRDVAAERDVEMKFMAVPDPKLAEEHLRILTQAPHIAGSPEDKATAEYVAQKISRGRTGYRDCRIQSMDQLSGRDQRGHDRARRSRDAWPDARARRRRSFQDDPRIVNAYNGMSPSGDAEADVVYANYGSPADFDKLEADEGRCARQDRHRALRPEFSRRESVRRAGARRGRRHHLFRSRKMTATIAAMPIPKGRGVRLAACSADPLATCSSFPAIRPRRA